MCSSDLRQQLETNSGSSWTLNYTASKSMTSYRLYYISFDKKDKNTPDLIRLSCSTNKQFVLKTLPLTLKASLSQDIILIGSNSFYLLSMVTESDILYNSSRMLQVTLAIVFSALVLMVLTILIIAHGFVKPLRLIGAKLKKVAQGDYLGQIEILSDDEFGQLSVSANQMTKDLKRSARKIEKQMTEIKQERERSEKIGRAHV